MDEYLSKRIRNWAALQKPPKNGKARLLRALADPACQQSQGTAIDTDTSESDSPWFFRGDSYQKNIRDYAPGYPATRDFPTKLFEWPALSSFDITVFKMKLIY